MRKKGRTNVRPRRPTGATRIPNQIFGVLIMTNRLRRWEYPPQTRRRDAGLLPLPRGWANYIAKPRLIGRLIGSVDWIVLPIPGLALPQPLPCAGLANQIANRGSSQRADSPRADSPATVLGTPADGRNAGPWQKIVTTCWPRGKSPATETSAPSICMDRIGRSM